jgi:hypothetical protein
MIITDYHRLRLARARGSDAGARAQTRQNQNARALFVTGCKYDCLTGNFNRSNIGMGELGQVRIYTTCENPKKL